MMLSLVKNRIWHAQQPVRFGPLTVRTRMTVVRLSTGKLWVHSPIEPQPGLRSEIASLGEVGFVVAPNKSHHLYFLPFLHAFPEARGFVASGLAEKKPELGRFPVLSSHLAEWEPELRGFEIKGLPALDETIWFHLETGTLILTDLLFSIGRETRGLGAIAARLLGVYDGLAMSRTMKMLIKDRHAFSRSVAELMELDVKRIILAHDQVIEDDPAGKFAEAFRWLPTVA